MSSSWEKFEELMKAEMRKVYSEPVVEHSLNPQNVGDLEDADGFARVTGPCGDTMEMFLTMKDGVVQQCTFQTDGCGPTIACGSVATELAQKKSYTQALGSVSADEILKHLGGLPEEDVHCAQLAAETLRRALADYSYQKKAPWKKNYRNT